MVTFSWRSVSPVGVRARSRSATTVSPSATGRPSTGSNFAARSRSRCSVWSTASSATGRRRPRSAMRGQIAGVERRHGLDRGRERQRLALFSATSLMFGRVDRLDAALLQRLVDGARDQAVHHVVEDLIAEALLDDASPAPCPAGTRDPRLLRVVLRDAVDLGVDDVARDLDREGLLRFADVGEFGFHRGIRDSRRASAAAADCPPSRLALRELRLAFVRACDRATPMRAARAARHRERERECERRDSNPHTLSGTRS